MLRQPGDTATCRYPNHWSYGREAEILGITERGAYRIRVGCDVICLEAIYLERTMPQVTFTFKTPQGADVSGSCEAAELHGIMAMLSVTPAAPSPTPKARRTKAAIPPHMQGRPRPQRILMALLASTVPLRAKQLGTAIGCADSSVRSAVALLVQQGHVTISVDSASVATLPARLYALTPAGRIAAGAM